MSLGLFSSDIIYSVEKKIERKTVEHKPIFQSEKSYNLAVHLLLIPLMVAVQQGFISE